VQKYVCPKCKKDVGEYGGFCCGYHVTTPAGDAATWGCMKIFVLIVVGVGLFLGIGMISGQVVGNVRNWRDAGRNVNTGLTLPITTINTTVIRGSTNDVSHYIAPNGDFREVVRTGWREPNTYNIIDTNVRSIEVMQGAATLYIRDDNSLWGFGNNAGGFLGTGTGVNVDAPTMILENVAKVLVLPGVMGNISTHHVFAIRTDRTLWMWGSNEFSPVQVAEDVVAFHNSSVHGNINIQKSDGVWFRFNAHRNEVVRIHPFAVLDFVGSDIFRPTSGSGFYINNENALVSLTFSGGSRRDQNVIAHDVVSLGGTQANMFFIDTNSNLWGLGTNAAGELGDGTKVPRQDTPVRIAENVICAGLYYYLTANGEFWLWCSENPTPEMYLENVSSVLNNRAQPWTGRSFEFWIFLNDGTLMHIWGRQNRGEIVRNNDIIHVGIMLPQTILFE